MIYLGDTSALVRLHRGQVADPWQDLAERGMIAICEPVLVETLTIGEARRYDEFETKFRSLYPWLHVPDGAWDVIRPIRQQLARRSAHQRVSVADYLVVATALHHDLTLLHEDADFETVAQVVPELRQQRISVLPESAQG